MRTVKESSVRKNEILDAAELLFSSCGYSKTTVSAILERVGIAKGTFYYYFKSKEDVLDAIIARRGELSAQFESIADAESAAQPAIPPAPADRLLRVLFSQKPMLGVRLSPNIDGENSDALIFQKGLSDALARTAPILADIISDGIEGGAFYCPFPLESAEILLSAAYALFEGTAAESSAQAIQRRSTALILAAERILGAKDGSLMILSGIYM